MVEADTTRLCGDPFPHLKREGDLSQSLFHQRNEVWFDGMQACHHRRWIVEITLAVRR
ncbi:MAG: hypothetical protein V3S24_04780 [Candidatus Tectomicrobia bacterium]